MTDPRPGLPPDHHCRTDDLAYESVGDWYADHRGRVPVVMAWKLSEFQHEHGGTFAEAFQAFLDRGAIILIEEDPA